MTLELSLKDALESLHLNRRPSTTPVVDAVGVTLG